MTIHLTAQWQVGDTHLDARIVPLLRMVAQEGSLNRAVAALKLSYRHAWGLLGKAERALGHKLVRMQRGRGARLSPFAEQLLAADAAGATLLARELAPALNELNQAHRPARAIPRGKPLVIHASHDLALAELKGLISNAGAASVELHFLGSLDCLASLARRDCDVAGFHVPEASADPSAFVPYRPWLRSRTLRLIRFVSRKQGLMVGRGNPKRLAGVADLVARGTRFVNRQPGSGTRLCFDRLLTAAHVRPEQINGYQFEEFTHAAVAAIVASGAADAAFGIEAAAAQHKLEFIPLVTERYFLALRHKTLSQHGAQALLKELRSPEFRACCRALPGYDTTAAGEIVTTAALGAP